MATVTPYLWFDDDLEEALDFYQRVFRDVHVLSRMDYPGDAPGGHKAGDLMTATVQLMGQTVMAVNGGPGHPHSDAFSFFVHCDDQAEADRYWEALADGGKPLMCGWVTDRFGITWQVIPEGLNELLSGPTPEAARRAHEAMMSQQRLDLDEIRRARDGA